MPSWVRFPVRAICFTFLTHFCHSFCTFLHVCERCCTSCAHLVHVSRTFLARSLHIFARISHGRCMCGTRVPHVFHICCTRFSHGLCTFFKRFPDVFRTFSGRFPDVFHTFSARFWHVFDCFDPKKKVSECVWGYFRGVLTMSPVGFDTFWVRENILQSVLLGGTVVLDRDLKQTWNG